MMKASGERYEKTKNTKYTLAKTFEICYNTINN